jgi:hypothetical protein
VGPRGRGHARTGIQRSGSLDQGRVAEIRRTGLTARWPVLLPSGDEVAREEEGTSFRGSKVAEAG